VPIGYVSSENVLLLGVALLAAGALAGCVGDEAVDPTDTSDGEAADAVADGWWQGSVPSSASVNGHDHDLHADHDNLTTSNFEQVGWDPLVSEAEGESPTSMSCGNAVDRPDDRRITLVNSISTDVAALVADVTDPQNPELVGEIYLPNTVTWDADLTPDGMHAIVGAYPVVPFGDPSVPEPPEHHGAVVEDLPPEVEAAMPDEPSAPAASPVQDGDWEPTVLFRDACSGEVTQLEPPESMHWGPGVLLFGLEDPSRPTFEDWRPQPVIGPHSVGSHEVGGTTFATASVTNLVHEASYYQLFEVVDTLEGSAFAPHTTIKTPGVYSPDLNGHTDVWVHEHPETGQTLAYLANWDGVYVYDVSTPGAPVELGSWSDEGEASMHTTFPLPQTRDGKQYLVAGQEVGEPDDRPTGWIYLLDVTDPANPQEVSRWTLPEDPRWDQGGLQFSTHYVDVLDDTLLVTVNHAGLWAVNISDIEEPRAEGMYVPDDPSPAPWGGGDHGPSVGDVAVDRETGVVTAWDRAGGVHQVTYDDAMPSPAAPPWEGAP